MEEAALIGAPSLVLDVHNDLARLGEPWPSRPAEFSDNDARKASAYFQRADVVVWTPGVSGGRPLTLNLLPDFARLQRSNDPDYLDERERAVDMALATLEPYLPGRGVKAMKLRGALADALRAFARVGGGSLDDLVRLLGHLPDGVSRIAEAAKLAREIAEQLLAAMATEPSLRTPAAPFDPAQLFEGPGGRTRVSVVNLSGLGSDAARATFVNQLQMTLFTWIKDHPSPSGRLYVLDEAQVYAPARESTACKKSALALVKQARKYGLGMIFATQEPRGVDHAILSNCLTHVYGRVSSPASIEAVRTMMAAKGGAADDLARLGVGEFYFATEGFSRPVKISRPALSFAAHAESPDAGGSRRHRAARGSATKQREIDDVDPTEQTVDDRPRDRVIGWVGDRHRQRRAEPDAISRAVDPDAVGPVGHERGSRCGWHIIPFPGEISRLAGIAVGAPSNCLCSRTGRRNFHPDEIDRRILPG